VSRYELHYYSRSKTNNSSSARKSVRSSSSTALSSTPPLTVLIYDSFPTSSPELDPRCLVQYDVILLSFQALKQGYHQTQVDHKGSRARFSEYVIVPPPFMCLSYSSLVVDESQNIESAAPTSKGSMILQMASGIRALRRISVSGTPIGGSRFSDLYCLTQFLHRVPQLTGSYRTWRNVLGKPGLPVAGRTRLKWLKSHYCQFMLRRTKKTLMDQLGLKPSVEDVKLLTFSEFEV